jgi:hypothetical protein
MNGFVVELCLVLIIGSCNAGLGLPWDMSLRQALAEQVLNIFLAPYYSVTCDPEANGHQGQVDTDEARDHLVVWWCQFWWGRAY